MLLLHFLVKSFCTFFSSNITVRDNVENLHVYGIFLDGPEFKIYVLMWVHVIKRPLMYVGAKIIQKSD